MADRLAAHKRHAAELVRRGNLRWQLKHADEFFAALTERNAAIGRETSQLMKLVELYGARPVEDAMAEAMAKGAVSAASVAHLLDVRARARKQQPPIGVTVPESVRHVRVDPHLLADYDSLLKRGES
jgi:hypothetical protein